MASNGNNNNNKGGGNHGGTDGSGKTLFGNVDFEEDNKVVIRRILERKMQPEHLSTRVGAGRTTFTYIESWKAIELANGIFGFDGWSSSITDMILDFIEPVCGGARFKCGVTAIVRVTLKNGSFHEDVGFGIGENKCKGTALEKAKKEAVSDARKRALRLFGNALGNSVYDKEFIESIDLSSRKPQSRPGSLQPSTLSPITYEGIRQSERSFSSPISRSQASSSSALPSPQQQDQHAIMSPPPPPPPQQQQQRKQQHLLPRPQLQQKQCQQPQQQLQKLPPQKQQQQQQPSSGKNSLDITVGENETDDVSFLDGLDLSQIGNVVDDNSIQALQQQQQQPPPPPPVTPERKKSVGVLQQQQQQPKTSVTPGTQGNSNRKEEDVVVEENKNNLGELGEMDDDSDLLGRIDLDDVMLLVETDNKGTNGSGSSSEEKQKTPGCNDTVLVPESTRHTSQEQRQWHNNNNNNNNNHSSQQQQLQQQQQSASPGSSGSGSGSGMPPKVNASQIDQVKKNLFMHGTPSPQGKAGSTNAGTGITSPFSSSPPSPSRQQIQIQQQQQQQQQQKQQLQ